MPEFSYRKRRFLSPVSSNTSSYIYAAVEPSQGGAFDACHCSLAIADCHRQIDLEFSLLTSRQRRHSLAKADLLIRVLMEFRAALEVEAKLIETTDMA